MKMGEIFKAASLKTWSCNFRSCKEKANYIRVHIQKSTKNIGVTLSGRCEKHHKEQDFTLSQFRKLTKNNFELP
jgi:hypothetical protein